jgi:hypothetical protein
MMWAVVFLMVSLKLQGEKGHSRHSELSGGADADMEGGELFDEGFISVILLIHNVVG